MKIATALLVMAVCLHAQFQNLSAALPTDTLAHIGASVITASDFLERFELMPWPHKDMSGQSEPVKLEFLRSMVAEKLLSIEASAKNIGNDSESVKLQRNLERMFVRDELYKQQVLPKVIVSDEERKEGMLRFPYQIQVQVLAIVSKADGDLLRKRVSRNKNKSSIFEKYKDSLFVPVDTLQITYGSAQKSVEDAVFGIGKDSLSQPVVTDFGMVMFRLLKREDDPDKITMSVSDRLRKVEKIIHQRSEEMIAKKEFTAVTSQQHAEADSKMFLRVADSVTAILRSDSLSYASNKMYKFPSSAIDQLVKKFSGELSETFITIASGNMTLSDVLAGLSNNNVLFPSLNPEHIRIVLNNNIKTVIQNELLARDGLKKNLNQSVTVRHDLAVWTDSRKNWLLSRTIMDTVTVSENEIESEYQQHPLLHGAVLAGRIREILVDSLPFAEQIRKRISNGESFGSLAKQFSKRKAWGAMDGESPWFIVTEMGALGQFAAVAVPGELVGPKQVKEGYSIFSVLEKKIVDDSLRSGFLKKKSDIARKLLSQKQQDALNKYIGTLAKKYNVTMDEGALRSVKTSTSNMVVWRNIGFGGRIVAVPQMFKQADWVNEWKKQQQVNQ